MGRSKQYDRDTAVGQALAVFWAKGFEASSLTELTEATGLNRKSLYHEFGSKEGLFLAALQQYLGQVEGMADCLQREPLGLDNVMEFLSGLPDKLDANGCLVALTLNENCSVPAVALSMARGAQSDLSGLIAANLASAVTQGEMRDDTPVSPLADYVIVVLQGLATLARSEPTPAQVEGVLGLLLDSLRSYRA